MQTRLEAAIAGEVLAEIKRQRYTYKEIQARADVKPRAFSYYFIAGERAIPFPVLAAVCAALDVRPSEIIARAENRVDEAPQDIDAELFDGLSPRNQKAAAEFLPPAAPSADRPTRMHHSA